MENLGDDSTDHRNLRKAVEFDCRKVVLLIFSFFFFFNCTGVSACVFSRTSVQSLVHVEFRHQRQIYDRSVVLGWVCTMSLKKSSKQQVLCCMLLFRL